MIKPFAASGVADFTNVELYDVSLMSQHGTLPSSNVAGLTGGPALWPGAERGRARSVHCEQCNGLHRVMHKQVDT